MNALRAVSPGKTFRCIIVVVGGGGGGGVVVVVVVVVVTKSPPGASIPPQAETESTLTFPDFDKACKVSFERVQQHWTLSARSTVTENGLIFSQRLHPSNYAGRI